MARNDLLIDHFNLIAGTIASSKGAEETLRQIAKSACTVLEADPVIVFRFDEAQNRLIPPPISSGFLKQGDDYETTFSFTGNTFAERIAQSGESLFFNSTEEIEAHPFMREDAAKDIEGRSNTRFHRREGIVSLAAIVLRANEETVGLMFLNYRRPYDFLAHRKLMDTFAATAAIAIRNSRLVEGLSKSEAFQRKVVDKIPDPVFVTKNFKKNDEMVWRIQIANQAAHDLFGYDFKVNEFEGKDVRVLLKSELKNFQIALRLSKGQVNNYELNMPSKNGEAVPISISTAILEQNREGQITRTISIAKDLRKRKELEEKLGYLNHATLSLLKTDNLEEVFDIVLENLRLIGYNRAMIAMVNEESTRIVGRRAIGQNWRDIVELTRVRLDSEDVLAQVVREGEPILIEDCVGDPRCNQVLVRRAGIRAQYVAPLKAKDKTIGTLQIGLSERVDSLKGDPAYFTESLQIVAGFANQVAVAIDAHQQKIHINRLQTTLADIAHEFKSPLHNIISQLGGLNYYLRKNYGDDESISDKIKIIQEEAYRADRQMRNALFSVSNTLESRGVNIERVNLWSLCNTCVKRFRESADKRFINVIVYDSVKSLPPVDCDHTEIEQVVSNLIDNAVKYSQPYENIEIRGEELGRKVQITVRNIGVGIPEKNYNMIFQGFARSDIKDPMRFIPGTGLGLKIAKQILESHNGSIFVRSKPFYKDKEKTLNYQGYENTFFVILPKIFEERRNG